MTAPRVVLVGPMGAGKSTVGGLLADLLGVGFRDTDLDVEQTAGTSISDLFVDRGETHFRALERTAVAAALAEHDGVLALGGGAVLDPESRALLAGHHVVFLNVGLTDAVKRVGLGTGRPLLLGNVRAQIRSRLEERAPIYAAVASTTIDTDERTPDDIARQIVRQLEEAEQ